MRKRYIVIIFSISVLAFLSVFLIWKYIKPTRENTVAVDHATQLPNKISNQSAVVAHPVKPITSNTDIKTFNYNFSQNDLVKDRNKKILDIIYLNTPFLSSSQIELYQQLNKKIQVTIANQTASLATSKLFIDLKNISSTPLQITQIKTNIENTLKEKIIIKPNLVETIIVPVVSAHELIPLQIQFRDLKNNIETIKLNLSLPFIERDESFPIGQDFVYTEKNSEDFSGFCLQCSKMDFFITSRDEILSPVQTRPKGRTTLEQLYPLQKPDDAFFAFDGSTFKSFDTEDLEVRSQIWMRLMLKEIDKNTNLILSSHKLMSYQISFDQGLSFTPISKNGNFLIIPLQSYAGKTNFWIQIKAQNVENGKNTLNRPLIFRPKVVKISKIGIN